MSVDAQHVGSTAVRDLPAKPILDIAVLIRTTDAVAMLTKRLTQAGYIYRGDSGDSGGRLFVRESEPDVRAPTAVEKTTKKQTNKDRLPALK